MSCLTSALLATSNVQLNILKHSDIGDVPSSNDLGKIFHYMSNRRTHCALKEDNVHRLHFWFAHAGLFWSRKRAYIQLNTLPFGLWIVLEYPRFVPGYHSVQKIWIGPQTFQQFTMNRHDVFLSTSDKTFSTNFVQMLFKSSVTIECTVDFAEFNSCAIKLIINRRSQCKSSRTCSHFHQFEFSSAFIVFTSSRPSLNSLCYF